MDAKRVFQEVAFHPQKMHKVNLCETERLFCDLYCVEPGQEQTSILIVARTKFIMSWKGVVLSIIGATTQELQQHHLVMAPSGEEHGVVNNSGDRLVLLVYMAPKP